MTNRTNITPAQQAQINRLTAELNMFRPNAQITPDQRTAFANALMAAGNTANPPSQQVVARLADNLTGALSGVTLNQQQRHQLAIDLNMLLHADRLSSTDTQRVVNDARSLLSGLGVTPEQLNLVTTDLMTLAGIPAQSGTALGGSTGTATGSGTGSSTTTGGKATQP
jgi:hemoglobin-like flavoprotein